MSNSVPRPSSVHAASRTGPPPITRPEATGEENTQNKLYVGNLSPMTTEYHILKLFRPFGTIVREQFVWHKHGPRRGEPRGFCFVEMSTKEEAEAAMQALNGKVLQGRPLAIRFVVTKQEEEAAAATTTSSTATTPSPGFSSLPSLSSSISSSRKNNTLSSASSTSTPSSESTAEREQKRRRREAKIKAIQAKLAMMEGNKTTNKNASGGGGPSKRGGGGRDTFRSRPY
ncbi:RNA-binding protein RbpA [Balamuthia mandrillaris]